MSEKADLERKVVSETQRSESIQSEITASIEQTSCQDCKKRQLKLTLSREKNGDDGSYWDLDSCENDKSHINGLNNVHDKENMSSSDDGAHSLEQSDQPALSDQDVLSLSGVIPAKKVSAEMLQELERKNEELREEESKFKTMAEQK